MLKFAVIFLLVSTTAAFSALSSFARSSSRTRSTSSIVMYDSESSSWSILANTERWISETLAAAPGNPYARKEVCYVCDAADDSALVTANLFKRLRQARELGERHGEKEAERREKSAASQYHPSTLRQTQVIVVPNNEVISNDFTVFHNLVEAINAARRQARDYVTDVALEKIYDDDDDDDEYSEQDEEWSVSVNCAHLHPKFESGSDDEADDPEYRAYLQRKTLARRSPYPTLVLEVRSQPPMDFGSDASASTPLPTSTSMSSSNDGDAPIKSSDIKKLEALFSQSANTKHPAESASSDKQQPSEETFYEKLANSIDKQVSSLSPMKLAQEWLTSNVRDLPDQPAILESNTPHVDAAYEFVFTNLAMLKDGSSSCHYLVMPRFLSSAATSAEKFATQVLNISRALPEWKDKVNMNVYHPEHVDPSKRSPMTIFELSVKK